MTDVSQIFLIKAVESLDGAESEFANTRYNNCANRCYYACFQAAIYALMQEGISPQGNQWGHAFVQAQFAGQLVNRRKLYSAKFRDTLERTYAVRQRADYQVQQVSNKQASRALARTREFILTIQDGSPIS